MTEYEFEAPDKLDEEQVRYLKKCGIIDTKRQDGKNLAIFIYDPKMVRIMEKRSVPV